MADSPFREAVLQELLSLRDGGLYRELLHLERLGGSRVRWEGRTYLDLSSNDYLGIAGDEALRQEFLGSLDAEGTISGRAFGGASSRLLSGNSLAYSSLEKALAYRCGTESALVLSTGYHANLAALTTFFGPEDALFSDQLNHASIIDGARLSGARIFPYCHLDLGHLEELLAQHRGRFRRAAIVSESLFSMDGDLADLTGLAELRSRFRAALVVDEAHAFGVFGPSGAGLCAALPASGRPDLLVGTFGKAVGSFGAFVGCSFEARELLINRARTLVFTTALPPLFLNWTRFVVEHLPGLEARRNHLRGLAGSLRDGLAQRGLSTAGDSQIVPVIIGENEAALAASDLLKEHGYLARAIRPPTVPPGTARLRLSLSANMTWAELAPLPDLLSPFAKRIS